jgi:SulP family sulfate permease
LLYSSMTLTALKAASPEKMVMAKEFENIAGGNLFCVLTCSPPGYTEVVGTSMYREFGASSRWMPLTTSFVGLAVILVGSSIIGILPKLLIGATIYLFAFQTLYDWLYANVRGFSVLDYATVCIILGTAVLFGFMTGILTGVVLTALLFVIRYSMISAIHSRATLKHIRSSVERSQDDSRILQRRGSQVLVYSLRGYLFFGTANLVHDNIIENEGLREGKRKALLLDLSRVTGVDIHALVTFVQIKEACESAGVKLVYAGVPEKIREKLLGLEAVSFTDDEADGRPLIFDEADFALEFLEKSILDADHGRVGHSDIRGFISDLIENDEMADRLLHAMNRQECPAGQALFRQGDPGNGLYFVERGSLSAFVEMGHGAQKRVRKFREGSLIGELSAYLRDKRRSASIIADEDSVLYHLNLNELHDSDAVDYQLLAIIHELVAATLAERVSFMNSRLTGFS